MNIRPRPELMMYELLEPLPYFDRTLPAGLLFNGASFPRITWTLFGYTPGDPRLLYGAAGHDDGYGRAIGLRRIEDDRFRITIIKYGVPEEHAAVIHAVLREHGRAHWMGNDPEDLAELARRAAEARRREEEAP